MTVFTLYLILWVVAEKIGKFLMFAAMMAAAIYTGGASTAAGVGQVTLQEVQVQWLQVQELSPHVAGEIGASQLGASGFSLGSMGTTLAVNAGLALVTSMFTKKPSDIKRTDQNSRQNNMFGSLKNTIDSGTPIMLNYGLFRVAGHFVSGYLDTTDHDASASITVQEKFDT